MLEKKTTNNLITVQWYSSGSNGWIVAWLWL